MHIIRVTSLSEELVKAIGRLIPQLKLDFPPPTAAELEKLIASDASVLLVARHPEENGPITGALTLVLYRVPTGIRARIEDVVVDEAERGQGIGEALVRYALKIAGEAGADSVALTSNPKREAANRLYIRLGFKPWKTNLFTYEF